jgi:hypothetical protein
MGKTLSKADIVSVVDIKTVEVEVPEWGGSVAVRELNGLERDAFEQSLMKVDAAGKRTPDLANMAAKLCAWCIVDGETGDRLFTDEYVHELANKNAQALARVFKVAQRINGMGAEAVEDAAKNSPAALSGSSTSA